MPQLDVHAVVDEHALLSFDDQLVIGSIAIFAESLHEQLFFNCYWSLNRFLRHSGMLLK